MGEAVAEAARLLARLTEAGGTCRLTAGEAADGTDGVGALIGLGGRATGGCDMRCCWIICICCCCCCWCCC